MKFFQKTSVAVIFTVLMIAAALFIGLSPALKSEPVPEPMAQTTAQEQTASQTPAAEQTSNTAGDETISDKYIRDDAGLFTRSGENAIQDYNTKIYHKTGSHIAILTTDSTGGKTLESYTNSAFDSMGLSEYDMLFAIDTSADEWYVTTGMYVADYTDSKLESIFQDGFSAILDSNADDAASDMYKDLYNWCQTSLNGAADMEYTPAQDTGRGRRKSMIGTILTILIIFWIIKAIFGSGRRGGRERRRRRLLVGPVPGLVVLEPSSPRPWSGARSQTRPAPRRIWRRPQTRRRQPRRLWRRTRRFRRRPQIKPIFPA